MAARSPAHPVFGITEIAEYILQHLTPGEICLLLYLNRHCRKIVHASRPFRQKYFLEAQGKPVRPVRQGDDAKYVRWVYTDGLRTFDARLTGRSSSLQFCTPQRWNRAPISRTSLPLELQACPLSSRRFGQHERPSSPPLPSLPSYESAGLPPPVFRATTTRVFTGIHSGRLRSRSNLEPLPLETLAELDVLRSQQHDRPGATYPRQRNLA